MEGLKSYTTDHAVQEALSQVLLRDANPGVRTQAIEMLSGVDDLDRQIVGVLQELMSREDDDYVRQRCQRALKAANASAEIY
jgi:HEAT repeat protein